MEFLYVRVSKRALGYNETSIKLVLNEHQVITKRAFGYIETILVNKTKNTNIVRDYNIINNNCIIMDENLKHV